MKRLLAISAVASALTLMAACTPQTSEGVTEEVSEEVTLAQAAEQTAAIEEAKTPTLTLLWETPATLITNESVLYDEDSGTIYVSNIEGNPTDKDGKGSISIIDKQGNIVVQEWVTGLNAPKGMGIDNGKFYVTDIDHLVEIDIASASITNTYPIEGAEFLNDVDTHEGKVYFSDMATGKVYKLESGEVAMISEGHASINGLAVGEDGTLFGLDASGLKYWNADGSTTIVNAKVTGGDGLVILGDGNFIASRWQGEIWFATADGETLMLDTKDIESNTADIGFIPEDNIVLVPTFFKNKVAAYKLNY